MRTREPRQLSPDVARELSALDAALAGEPVGAEHAELGDLALTLRSERPLPRPEFAAGLDERASAGFRARGGRSSRRLAIPRRALPLALGTAAAVFIAVTAVLSTGQNSERPSTVNVPTAGEGRSAGAAPGRAAGAGAPVPPSPADETFPARGRKVERSAALVLAAPSDEIENVADGVIRTTDRYGGFVMSSSVSSGGGQTAGATLDLRIPSSRLQPALAELSKLAHVRSRTQGTRDITAEFRSPRRALAAALAERRALLRELADARTANQTASIRARLRFAERRVEHARTSIRRLDARVGLARVSVGIEPGRERGGQAWTLGDAFRDARSILTGALGALIVGLSVAIPIGLAAIAVLAGRRSYLRRAREHALDSARPG